MTLKRAISEHAKTLGFTQIGFVRVEEKPTNIEPYNTWLAEGRHGNMTFMENHITLRHRPDTLENNLKTAIVLTANYRTENDVLDGGLRIARYAQGDDYHRTLRAKLDALAAFITAETGRPVAQRPAVDTAPILERELAVRAGLGWIGKNSLLIDREHGSFNFVAELLVDLVFPEDDNVVTDSCGTCSACIDVCPTNAIVSPYVIDARRCIAYLTIELRGPIPRALRPKVMNYLFGCDLCQDVCPWNHKSKTETMLFATRPTLQDLSPIDVLEMDTLQYQETFRHSAMKRAKQIGLQRNAAVVIGNSGDVTLVDRLAQCFETREPLVRGHIAWAIGQLGNSNVLRTLLATEVDQYVVEEIRYALQSTQD